jgi:hypothetical protein
MRNQQMRKTQLPFLALCAVLLGGPVASEVKIFGDAVALAKVPGIELSRKQQRHFNEFKAKKSYFGAFYAAPGTDYSFWTRNFHSLNSAKMGAKKGCELGAKVAKCSLVAVLFPKGMDPNGNGLAGLGQRAGKEFASTYVKKQKKVNSGPLPSTEQAIMAFLTDGSAPPKQTPLLSSFVTPAVPKRLPGWALRVANGLGQTDWTNAV